MDLRKALLPLFVLAAAAGCNDNAPDDSDADRTLVAKRIESQDELIGGPSARGKVGDFLIENDQVRFIVAGKGQAWMGGVFGGTLLDADVRRSDANARYGKGWDSFSETFPLVNLIETNPELPGNELRLGDQGISLLPQSSDITVVKDGSDGKEAIVRVSGRAGYIFEMLKFLNKDFLQSYLGEIQLMGTLTIPQVLHIFLEVNVYALLNRLQVDFRFENDYVLQPGQRYLTIRTTVHSAPPSAKSMASCPAVSCEKDCPNGYALRETAYPIEDGAETCDPAAALCGLAMCPACFCADAPRPMATMNESEDIFHVILGDLPEWRDPTWKGGILGGDFLFMGKEANIFAPGLGFDEQRKIFENLWQEVPSLASPLVFDWVAAVGTNVSYGWVTRNPDRRDGAACPDWRIALTSAGYEQEQAVVEALVGKVGLSQAEAETRVRQLVVDRRPVVLASGIALPASEAADLQGWKASVLAGAKIPGIAPGEGTDAEPVPAEHALAGLFPAGVAAEVIPSAECMPSKLVIPIFSTSATAVMTHKSPSSMEVVEGAAVDRQRSFTFERYFVVGDGDVGSVLDSVFELNGTAAGHVRGVVMNEATRSPVTHASVIAALDPRVEPGEPAPETYDALIAANRARFGSDGLVSQMQTDVGLDPVADGRYEGPLAPGRYFLVAFTKDRGVSRPIAVTVEAGRTEVAHLLLPQAGAVQYRVVDQSGYRIPCRLTFIPKGESGEPMEWDGLNRVELGGSRYDHGIMANEHSATGEGSVPLPPGRYQVWVSRGFEYGVQRFDDVLVEPGRVATLSPVLLREVDTSGYVSGDFHVHARPSIDSGLHLCDRVVANAAEGLELITSTDHDFLTDYRPYVNELGLHKLMSVAVGVETTTLEFGHYNGYPMRYDDTDLPVHDPPPWYGHPVGEIWEMMRDRVADGYSRDELIVQVNHPRDGMMGYFSQMGLSGYDLERKTPGMSMCNPQTENISCAFDAMEIMNEKRFELLRTPTIAEVDGHNRCLTEVLRLTRPETLHWATKGGEPACAWLQKPPHDDCGTIAAIIASTTATGLERAALFSRRDHCRWHEELRVSLAGCSKMALVPAKRCALDALKLLQVRYQIERTPEEQAAFFGTRPQTDLGCDMEKAMAGCTPQKNDKGAFTGGCVASTGGLLGGEPVMCTCLDCVCAAHPECCLDPGKEGEGGVKGTGWDDACAAACRGECSGCGVQPCTDKTQPWDDWFSFLNHTFAGKNVTAMGNSDSHDTLKEVGLPRNYIPSGTDDPFAVDQKEIFRNIREHRVVISTGPFANFRIDGAAVGDTLAKPAGPNLRAAIRIQTASWFGVDRIEIHRNAKLEHVIRIETPKEAIVDFDEVVELPMPAEDSWYVIVAFGLSGEHLLTPVYKRSPMGQLLIPTILAMGAKSLLISFQGLLAEAGPLLDAAGTSLDSLLSGLLGSQELPDVFPIFPLVVTNPIWVDLDGDGFDPPEAKDRDGDGVPDIPPFCSQPCTVALVEDEAGAKVPGQSTCGTGQLCVADEPGGAAGTCLAPIPDRCVGAQTE